MQIGNFEVSGTKKKRPYKIVYVAQWQGHLFHLHEYADPDIAEHELKVSKYLSSTSAEQFSDKFTILEKTYLVQENIESVAADKYFEKAGTLSKKVSFAISIFKALQEIHEKGVIYNNLSLETVSITADGKIVLHDFAQAIIIGGTTVSVFHQPLNPHFVAPERTGKVEGDPSPSSDYYSFGIMLYWLLAGKLPFEAESISQLISLHVARQHAPICSVAPHIPDGLSQIVDKLLEKEQSRRYKSAEGLLYDLAHYDEPGFQAALHDMDVKFKVSEKIYGREWETGQLRETLRSLADGKSRLVTIAGYSGVGKSTIVSEFQKSLGVDDCRLISGKFQQYKKDIPYFAIVEAFDELFDSLLLSDEQVLNDFRKAFKNSIGDQGLILTSIFPKLELIVGEQAPVDRLVGEEAENRFNYIFLKLLSIIATEERPLVLFLDDLQWTDLVSLNVLRAIFQNDVAYILIVLCYRSNEVDLHHPFHRFLDEIENLNVQFQQIQVGDLRPDDVERLIRDSLRWDNRELSKIVFEKTHGNAFFVHQLLRGLADEGLFQRDVDNRRWTIDLKKVRNLQVSSNVVDLMQTRLERFPPEVIDLVKIIGAVGHNSNLDVLSVVTGESREAITQTLKLPFEDGLLYERQNHVYFTHDKIQQACYQLNKRNELPKLHFTIANTLIRHELFQSLDELFNLVGHLDKGFTYIDENFEQYIDIYMMAALKSKEISAYQEFLVYVRQAMSLLHDSLPETVRFQVYREYHIALYLNSRFAEADDFFYEQLAGLENLLELKENYFSKVSQDSMLRNYKEATEFGISILKMMGIELKIDPPIEDLVHELDEVEALFERAGIQKISDLGRIERKNIKEMEFICELILAMVPAAFFHNPTVACLLIFTTLKLAINNGVFEAMGYPLSVASTPFILIRNDYRSGYEYAEYAMQIAANNKRSLGNAKHLFILFCWHWSRPMKDDTSLNIARDAHHLLMQGGDIQMAGYTFYNTVTYLWERGEKLEVVLEEANKGLDYNRKTQNLHGTALISPHYQVVRTLLSDDGDFLHFSIDGFDEEDFIENNEQNLMGLCFFYIYKTQLAYLFGCGQEAYANGLQAKRYLHFITGFPSTHSGVFYSALSGCLVLGPGDNEWSTVVDDLEQLRRWCDGAPENFRHKLHLLEAEIARKTGAVNETIRCYTKAITAAKQSRFMHETALIYERFSSFWQEQENQELFEYYIKQAFHFYELWGAKRKCEQLQHTYQNVFLESQTQNLDLLSVIHSQNVLAQETNTESLLRQMIQILLEVSGAERVFLLLRNDDWSIEAYKTIQGDESILQGKPLREDMLSVDMIHYVVRTGHIANLDQFSSHLEDSYLTRVKPQSLVVLPATVSSRIIAVIYLEHRRIKNMFTQNKQEMIKLLSTQIAISLNNARIYNQLEERVLERTKELAAQNEELAIARKKADEANEAKSEFLANMSHELRTPLNAVTGFSELLSNLVDDARQKSYLDAIKSAGRNLLTLINDILDLSKIEAGRLDISYMPVDLKALFMEIEQIFNVRIQEKHLEFSITHAKELPERLYLDEIRMRQILLNLVGNAIKFTTEGYIHLSSQVVAKENNVVDLTIAVEDSGIGIAEEDRERIFRSFEQQSEQDAAKYGGTGLGLAITKRLVELMAGTIAVTSVPNEGSLFTINLSDVRIASSEDQVIDRDTVSFESVEFSRATVLVVDDIESNRMLLAEVLARVGLQVVVAKDGQEAVLLTKELLPDLIIMDIRMPVLSGFEAAESLKSHPETKHIPIIALTASSTQKERTLARSLGFAEFLAKPINFDRLLATLSQYLEHKTVANTLSANADADDPLVVDIEKLFHPELLIQHLEDQVLPGFTNLQKAFVAGDFKKLAKILASTGKEHGITRLIKYGDTMMKLLDSFDIQEINTSLIRYENEVATLLENLRSHDRQ